MNRPAGTSSRTGRVNREGEIIVIRRFIIAFVTLALGACSSSPNGRLQLAAPPQLSAVYSEVNMQLLLITEANSRQACEDADCTHKRAFDRTVLRLGTRLAQTAFENHPALTTQFDKFEFVIAEKSGPGTLSSSAGRVVIFRGVQNLKLGEEALAFLIAREMGHVISRHHEENSATSILFSVLAAVFIPMSNLISGSAALAQTASASAMSSAATSAASFIGSKLTIASYKQEQSHEADVIALSLLKCLGWSSQEIADALVAQSRLLGTDSWCKDLRESTEDVVRLAGAAQNNINELKVVRTDNGKTVISVGLTQAMNSFPEGFTTSSPPRIVLDFNNTTTSLGKAVQDFSENNLHSTQLVQSFGRTRLVLNLNRMLSYNTRLEDKHLLITLQGKATKKMAQGNDSRFATTDTHQSVY